LLPELNSQTKEFDVAKKRSPENTKKKQAYVAELVKGNAGISMNEAGKKVKAKFGTQLAYDKLRDAFAKAGGKIDTRRGPKKGSKRKPRKGAKSAKKKSGSKSPRSYGTRSPAATRKKQAFVAELVKGKPDITMNEAGKRVRAKFGTQLAFDKLKEAFKAAGGKVGKPGRRKGSRKHVERRQGRRASDRAYAKINKTLKGMPKHVVIMHQNGNVDTSEFNTKDQAVAFARSQVLAGVSVSDIAYYTRQALEISVGI
jgi:transposase